MNRDRFMKLQRESLAFLQEESTRLREEIQKLFSSSQDYVAKTQRLKDECGKQLALMKPQGDQLMLTAINQEKFIIQILKNLQSDLETSNQQLFQKLNFYRDVVNVNNKTTSSFLQTKTEQFTQSKKMLQVHLALAIKYKQRTDGFVVQNFEKNRTQDLGVTGQVSDLYHAKIVKFWNLSGGSQIQLWTDQASRLLEFMTRYQYIKQNCLEGQEASKNYLRGTFDDLRLIRDQDISQLAQILNVNENSMRQLINKVRKELIKLYAAQTGREKLKKLADSTEKLQSLSSELKTYNRVFTVEYEKFMDEALVQIRAKVKNSDINQKKIYMKDVRERKEKIIDYISWVKDLQGKSASDYKQLIFGV